MNIMNNDKDRMKFSAVRNILLFLFFMDYLFLLYDIIRGALSGIAEKGIIDIVLFFISLIVLLIFTPLFFAIMSIAVKSMINIFK
jgi:hypothetical protein